MVNWRHQLANLRIHWNNLRRSVQPYLNYGRNQCLDLILIGGGICPVAGAEPWKRNCLILYRLLGFYQFILAVARVGTNIHNQSDMVELCASIMVVVTMITCWAKVYTLEHYGDVVRQAKTFLSCNLAHSGDPDYDASVRGDAARAAGKVTLIVFLFICCEQVMVLVPNSARDRIFGIPKQFEALGFMAARLMQEAFVWTLFVFWICRYYCCTLTIMPLIMGLRSELMIVARGYETIEERVQVQVLEDQKTVAGTSQKLQSNVLRWKHLKQFLGTTVEQHVEILRNIKLVHPFISIAYAFTYYCTMLFVSLLVFLVIRSGVTLVSIVLILAGVYAFVECYFWCHLIDSIEGIMENITDSAAQLGSRLEHSLEHHSKYKQMRTSLMIIQINASQRELFSCGGIFPISVESFGNLCMIIYRLTTFLLKIDKDCVVCAIY